MLYEADIFSQLRKKIYPVQKIFFPYWKKNTPFRRCSGWGGANYIVV